MHKDKILSLRDLALEHLPKVREQRDLMSKHGRTIALQAVAGGPLKTFYNPASTAIEKRAASLLNLVHKHPDTTTEGLYPADDDMGAALEAILLDDARKIQPEIEAAMLEDARLLCELSGSPLPPWMVGSEQQAAPATDTAKPAPVVTVGDGPAAPVWSLKRPERFQGYGKPLHDLLKAAHATGQPKPSARDVLDRWKEKPPPDVAGVTDNGLKYYDAKGNTKPADLEAIRKTIGRMTT